MKFKLYQPLAIFEKGKRDNQEDCIFPLMGKAMATDRLFIVCDGMGGHEHGEVASQTFSQGLAYFFKANVSPSDVLEDDTLKAAIEFAYQRLDKKDDNAFKKMGTTLTLACFHRGGVTCAHIGDSRIYHIRPGRGLLYVSRDHSLVFDLYQSGEITYDEMKTSPQRNIITRAVQPGEDNRVRADIIHITDVEPGDYFYLCSDGMLEQMENDELAALFSSNISDEKKRQRLIDETVDNKDNHSAYILHVESVTREAGDEKLVNEEPTARCNALNIRPIPTDEEAPLDASDDVEVVGNSRNTSVQDIPLGQRPNPQKRSVMPILFTIVALVIAGFVAYSLLSNNASGKSGAKTEKTEKSVDKNQKSKRPDSNRQNHIFNAETRNSNASPSTPEQFTDRRSNNSDNNARANNSDNNARAKKKNKDGLGKQTSDSRKQYVDGVNKDTEVGREASDANGASSAKEGEAQDNQTGHYTKPHTEVNNSAVEQNE